jgi:MoaA/NifB/PqqE/SkfB family radical SAM enzyme
MRDVTLLWALRSPCNLGCRYCYFGTIEDHRAHPPQQPGQLSHLSRTDLPAAEIDAFLASAADSAIRRVVLAGGEPLIWPHTLTVVASLTAAGVQVVVCTNGIPLNRPEIVDRLLDGGVAAVSVSLDSTDPQDNDRYRPSRNGVHGFHDVVTGVRALRTARGARPTPKIGLYTVVTRRNLAAMGQVAAFAADLDLDYVVPQPISLTPTHPLHGELALRDDDAPALHDALDTLYTSGLGVDLPDSTYRDRFLSAATSSTLGHVRACFGGHTLFFIQPDGSVWDCPSTYKIVATPATARRSIRGQQAAEMFPLGRHTCARDCSLFSDDCVSMWPLMGFDRFLSPDGNR